MKKRYIIFLLLLGEFGIAAGSQNPYESADLKLIVRYKRLPVPLLPKTPFEVRQGAFGHASHREHGNEYNWDLAVPLGTPVLASGAGVVLEIWAPQGDAGCDPKYSNLAHNIKVRHLDGTVAQYVHVDPVVKVGQRVKQGEQIAKTAHNGWICYPHLHFGVYASEKQLYPSIHRNTLPMFFQGVPGGILRQGEKYITATPRTTGKMIVYTVLGVNSDGTPRQMWLKAIKDRHSQKRLHNIAESPKVMSIEQRQWMAFIISQLASWSQGIQSLAIPFPGVRIPKSLTLLLGNNGGDDGFTFGLNTIALDLSAWQRAYGSAKGEQNAKRVQRILSHEATHLLHKAWAVDHPIKRDTPLERALWTCLFEGIATYRSLSARWLPRRKQKSKTAREVLKRLQPIFVKRLMALGHKKVTEPEERRLRVGISGGPFSERWGALTIALWFSEEAQGKDSRLKKWVIAGPEGILSLAQKHLPPALSQKLSSLHLQLKKGR